MIVVGMFVHYAITDLEKEVYMAKGTLKDSVLEDARKKALSTTHLPKAIKDNFKVQIKSGSIILTSKNISGKSVGRTSDKK